MSCVDAVENTCRTSARLLKPCVVDGHYGESSAAR